MNGAELLPSLSPAFFVQVRGEVARKETSGIERKMFKLPHYAWLVDEEPFADVYMGWNQEGVSLFFEIDKAFEEARYPQYEEGDSVELFLDTRDMKQATYAHRFCHHFLILPAEVHGVRALEITRLRADDKRPLCEADDLYVEAEFGKKKYTLKIGIPSACLYGFDPEVCDRLGFTYRINRGSGSAQHFSISSRSCPIAQYPAVWASMKLT